LAVSKRAGPLHTVPFSKKTPWFFPTFRYFSPTVTLQVCFFDPRPPSSFLVDFLFTSAESEDHRLLVPLALFSSPSLSLFPPPETLSFAPPFLSRHIYFLIRSHHGPSSPLDGVLGEFVHRCFIKLFFFPVLLFFLAHVRSHCLSALL